MGLHIGHYIPLIAYLGFWIMSLVSLGGKPLLGLYYMIPFLPYRTMRDHFFIYPLGASVLTILVVSVILGAMIHGKRLPKSPLYGIWLVYGVYLYLSMWLGMALSNAPAPLWLSDVNFVTWKDYMLIPLVFVAASLVIDDRRSIRMVVIITALSVLFIDRSCLLESMSRTWTNFDENKRDTGPLAYGANQTAAYLAQFAMFFWGFTRLIDQKKKKILGYGLVVLTLAAMLYTFSRGAYLAVLVSILVLGIFKDRKILLLLGVFMLTWQSVVPTAVRERVTMTKNSDGQLEASAQDRVSLWENAETSILRSPIVGAGFATFQLGDHVDALKDTHNWYVKVLVETGFVGLFMVLYLLQQLFALSYRLFKRATDPLYQALGLGLLLASCSCVIANIFGDRWQFLEISGPLWILVGSAIRATQLTKREAVQEPLDANSTDEMNPYLAYRQRTASA